MELPIEDFSSYVGVDTFDDLIGPGSRIFRLPAEQIPSADMVIAAGRPTLRLGKVATSPIQLRCVKVARALCVHRGVVIDLDTGCILPDVMRKPPPSLPDSIDIDLTELGLPDTATDWERVPARREPNPGLIADSWYLGYGHVLLEALSRCWALEDTATDRHVVVTHKAARTTYRPWFESLGIQAGRLRSTRRGPMRIDNLLVPSQAYILDRGMSPRFHAMTRKIAQTLGPADGDQHLFVSRRGAPKRRLVNESEVEAMFRARGFRILHPEQHSLAEQVRAFAGATVVAGPVGSGLYSIAFAKPSTRLLVLAPSEFYTRNDQILAGAREQPPVFAFGRSEARTRRAAMLADWYLEPTAATTALDLVLDGL